MRYGYSGRVFKGETYQWIMRVLRRLGDQHTVGFGRGFDEVMSSYISHDLRARIDRRPQLLLDSNHD